jgi:periplasmic copper chaperone A
MNRVVSLCAGGVLALAWTSVAGAHVTVHPNAIPSGAFVIVNVRVPNERTKTATTKVDVKFPAGTLSVRYQRMPGWRTKVTYRKLANPVRVSGQTVTTEADRVIWTATSRATALAPGQVIEFPISLGVPKGDSGTLVTFKALQTYSNGEVVRWIGVPSSDNAAPQIMLRGANTRLEDYPAGIPAIPRSQSVGSLPLGVGLTLPIVGLGLLAFRKRRRT